MVCHGAGTALNSNNIATCWISVCFCENRFLVMHVLLCTDIVTVECPRWNVLTCPERWLSLSLHRTCPHGDERLRISEMLHFNFIHLLSYCLNFHPPHLVVASTSSYFPRLLLLFVFISLGKKCLFGLVWSSSRLKPETFPVWILHLVHSIFTTEPVFWKWNCH